MKVWLFSCDRADFGAPSGARICGRGRGRDRGWVVSYGGGGSPLPWSCGEGPKGPALKQVYYLRTAQLLSGSDAVRHTHRNAVGSLFREPQRRRQPEWKSEESLALYVKT